MHEGAVAYATRSSALEIESPLGVAQVAPPQRADAAAPFMRRARAGHAAAAIQTDRGRQPFGRSLSDYPFRHAHAGLAGFSFGDVAMAVDHAPGPPSKASALEQPNRRCICKQSKPHRSAGALLTASCALPAARPGRARCGRVCPEAALPSHPEGAGETAPCSGSGCLSRVSLAAACTPKGQPCARTNSKTGSLGIDVVRPLVAANVGSLRVSGGDGLKGVPVGVSRASGPRATTSRSDEPPPQARLRPADDIRPPRDRAAKSLLSGPILGSL